MATTFLAADWDWLCAAQSSRATAGASGWNRKVRVVGPPFASPCRRLRRLRFPRPPPCREQVRPELEKLIHRYQKAEPILKSWAKRRRRNQGPVQRITLKSKITAP